MLKKAKKVFDIGMLIVLAPVSGVFLILALRCYHLAGWSGAWPMLGLSAVCLFGHLLCVWEFAREGKVTW
jgi:hypothetical protein